MKNARRIDLTGALALAAGLIGAGLCAFSVAQAQAGPSIAGAWTLNRDLSDDPREGIQQGGRDADGRGRRGPGGGGWGRGGGMGGPGGGMGRMGGGGRGGPGGGVSEEDRARMRDAMRQIVEAPERLAISQTANMVSIAAPDGRVTRLSTDGRKIRDESTKIERKTKWAGGTLVSEISGLGAGRITESYAVDPEHHQLVVTIQMENPRMPKPMTMRRVYDADAR